MRTLAPSNSSNMRAGLHARYVAWDKLASSKLQLQQFRVWQQALMSRTYLSTGAEQAQNRDSSFHADAYPSSVHECEINFDQALVDSIDAQSNR